MVTIPAVTTGVGEFALEVRESGVVVDAFTWEMTDAGTHDFLWTITRPVGTSIPSIDITLFAPEGNLLAVVDSHDLPAEVANSCSAAVPPKPVQPDLPAIGSNDVDTTLLLGLGLLGVVRVPLDFAGSVAKNKDCL